MGDNRIAGPSLLLARHDEAHREHLHQHHNSHRRRQAVVESLEAVVTVVATVSVVQGIDVDASGSTFSSLYILPNATTTTDLTLSSSAAATTEESTQLPSDAPSTPSTPPTPSTIETTTPASPGTAIPSAAPSSTTEATSSTADSTSTSTSQSLIPTPDTAAAPTDSLPSIAPGLPSLISSSNSTTLISTPSTSASSQAFTNSTSITSTITSTTTSIAVLAFTTTTSGETSTSSSLDPSFESFNPASTSAGGFIGGGRATSGGTTSATASAGNNGGSDDTSTPTPVVVGSVVGSIASAAILIFLLMFILRWKKRNQSMLQLSGNEGGLGADTSRSLPPTQPAGEMAQRRSMAFAVPDTLAALGRFKRSSQKTDRTISSTEGSERGFYRVSGRKLPSVFQNGGDGYGDPFADQPLHESSFYRDSQGFYGGPGSPSSPNTGPAFQRDNGIPVMRPSPARTPVTEHAPLFPAYPPPTTPLPQRPDLLGRSHPSHDASHASRFTEEV